MDKGHFLYSQNAPFKVFPIDFSLREFDSAHNGNFARARNVAEHPFIKDTLVDLIWDQRTAQKKFGYECGGKYPLPVEAETFLRCFYELIENPTYHTTKKTSGKLDDASLKQQFSIDLCLAIAEHTFTSETGSCYNDAVYCRRTLCQEDGFGHVIMDDLWENELTARINQVRQLAVNVSPERQAELLQNVLLTLDGLCLELIRFRQSDSTPTPNTPPAPNDLLRRLLSKRIKAHDTRRQSKSSERKLASYKVENASIEALSEEKVKKKDLEAAFFDLENHRNADRVLLEQARRSYLENLERAVDESAFEREYWGLRQYMDVISEPPDLNKLEQLFTDIMKEQCRNEIDHMMQIIEKRDVKQPVIRYLDALICNAAQSRAFEGIQCFSEIRNLIWSFATISTNGAKLKNQSASFHLDSNIDERIPFDIPLIPQVHRKRFFVNLQKTVGNYWLFTGNKWPIDDLGHFIDLEKIAAEFAHGAQKAVDFFNKGRELTRTTSEVCELLQLCEDYVLQEDEYMPANEIANLSFPILSMAMLQTLQRITTDGVTRLLVEFPILQEVQAQARVHIQEQKEGQQARKRNLKHNKSGIK